VAEHVARKLVEYDDERERAFRCVIPRQPSGGRGLVGRKKTCADLGVEGGVLREPLVRPGGAPEGENGLRIRFDHELACVTSGGRASDRESGIHSHYRRKCNRAPRQDSGFAPSVRLGMTTEDHSRILPSTISA